MQFLQAIGLAYEVCDTKRSTQILNPTVLDIYAYLYSFCGLYTGKIEMMMCFRGSSVGKIQHPGIYHFGNFY